VQRQPRAFDGACREDDGRVRRKWKESPLSRDVDLDRLHDAARHVQLDHVCQRYEEEVSRRVVPA
jgi:hypothetical protein